MSWHNSGAWSGLELRPGVRTILEELCTAVNEREAALSLGGGFSVTNITRSGTVATVATATNHGIATGVIERMFIYGADQSDYNGIKTVESVAVSMPNVSSITRSGSTATVTTASAHGLLANDIVTMSGAAQPEYNGAKTVLTAPTSTTFTYAVTGTPATPATGSPAAAVSNRLQFTVGGSPTTPATGTIIIARASTQFHYDKDFNAKRFPADTDFEDMPVHRVTAAAQTVTSIVQSLGTMYVRLPGHGRRVGDYVKIDGANEDGYNGDFIVTSVPGSISLTSITRSGSTATATAFAAHGLSTGDIVYIAGADQAAYNGAKSVTVTSSTVFTFGVSGSPATPATGATITMKDYSRFEYTSDSNDPSATGTVTAQGRRTHIYYAEWSGGTGTVYARNHGFSVGQWIHIQHDSDSSWRLWVKVATASSHEFTFAHSGSLSAATYSSTAGFWCARPCGIRIVAQQLRSAIETLLNTNKFVVDDGATYDTPYTITSALTAGSFGSSWISLVNCERNAVGDVLEQIREVLDVMVFVQQELEVENIGRNSKAGTGSTQAASWSDLIADTESAAAVNELIANFSMVRSSSSVYDSNAITSSENEYSWTELPGSLVAGGVRLHGNHPGDVSASSLEVTDDDADSWVFDGALDSATQTVTVYKPDTWFSANPKTLNSETTLGSEPFDAMAVGDSSTRLVIIVQSFPALSPGFVCYNISSEMTYG